MLEFVELENFKSFGTRQVAPLAPITLVFGPNSAGKSSLIQSLLLMKQSLDPTLGDRSGLVARGPLADLGNFLSLLHCHDPGRELFLGYQFSNHGKCGPGGGLAGSRPDRGHYGAAFRLRAGEGGRLSQTRVPRLEGVHYRFLDGEKPFDCALVRADQVASEQLIPAGGESVFRWAHDSMARMLAERYWRDLQWENGEEDSPRSAEFKTIHRVLKNAEISEAPLFPRYVVRAASSAKGGPGDHQIRWGATGLLELIARATAYCFERIYYLGPLRSYPERFSHGLGGERNSVGTRGQHTSEVIFQNGGAVTRAINRWFREFEIPYQLEVSSMSTEVTGDIIVMTLIDQRTGVKVSPSDVGFGIGQLLPIIVEGAMARERTICVEQPEIHLHPRLQAHFADFFIETSGLKPVEARSDGRTGVRNQWILETHSESLMLRIQSRIREGRIAPEDVSVLYIHPSGEQGSEIRPLRLDDRGEFLDEWPGGFFEDNYRELFGSSR